MVFARLDAMEVLCTKTSAPIAERVVDLAPLDPAVLLDVVASFALSFAAAEDHLARGASAAQCVGLEDAVNHKNRIF
jgi:hypothetical protein